MHRKRAFLIYSEESMEYCNTTDSLLIMLSWVWFVMYFPQRMKLAAREELQVYREKYLMFLDGLSDQERAQLLLQKRAKKETRANRKHKMVTSFVWLADTDYGSGNFGTVCWWSDCSSRASHFQTEQIL